MPVLPRTLALVALLAAGCILVMGTAAAPAAAHAPLVGTSPKAGSKLTEQPRRVLVTFGEEIRSGSIVVKNASGKIVSRGPNGKDPTDVRRLRVALKPNLKNGRYKVSWKVASADGDPEAGTFAFRLI
jgi:methionine-rich copper-binding protein CopC